jgi:bifunctional enzyme Fae/Hps
LALLRERIYRYNYAATKLALKGAMSGFPDINVVLEETPKATHAMIGFRINNLEEPPYLGVELVIDEWRRIEGILRDLPRKDGIIVKAGAPLIKKFGVEVCQKIHEMRPESVVIADMKSLDTGNLEARMAGDATADVVAFSALAPLKTQERFIKECRTIGVLAYMDTINVSDPLEIIDRLEVKPDIVELRGNPSQDMVGKVKEACGEGSIVAVASEVDIVGAKNVVESGVAIVMLSETITESTECNKTASAYLEKLGIYEVDQFRIMTDF